MEMVAAKIGEREPKGGRETVLRDFVRFSWRATRGLTTAAEAEGREVVRRMVGIGRVTSGEGEKLLLSLQTRMQLSRTIFEQRVDASIRRAVEKLGELSTKELSRLGEQATRLEKRLENLAERKRGR